MRVMTVASALLLATVLPMACASFVASESGPTAPTDDAATDGGGDGGGDEVSSRTDAPPEPEAGAARTLYVFGGATNVDQTETPVYEAYAATILDDGLLGTWQRAPTLDVTRSHPTTIAPPNGIVAMVGGNGASIGQGPTSNFGFFLDDVSVVSDGPLASWQPATPLGAGNGRWAAAGAFAAGNVYVSGGVVAGDGFTASILAAPVVVSPPSVQAWKAAGTLPVASADHGLVAVGSRLYLVGGAVRREGGVVASAETFTAPILGDGTVGEWMAMGSLPQALEGMGVVSVDARVFAIGGDDGAANASAAVYVGVPSGTAPGLVWQATTPMRHARTQACVVRANGRIYVIGGDNVGAVSKLVEVGDPSGPVIAWREATPMPVSRSAMGCFAR